MGNYLIISSLGEGTFGKVKLAVNEQTGAQVALKIMDKSEIYEQAFTLHVRREIAIMKALTHHNIVKLHHVLTSSHKLYLVMEAVNGGELWALISRSKHGLPEDLARFFFTQLVDGVQYCHKRGVVHRDLKPENILITSNGDLKITDFGLSRIKTRGKTTDLLMTACGTPNYISPEVLDKRRDGYDGKKLDVWSCGIILFSLLSGYLPYDRKTQQEIISAIVNEDVEFPSWLSEDSKDLVRKMLTKNPKRRIGLRQVQNHPWVQKGFALGSPSPPPPPIRKDKRKTRPRRRRRRPRDTDQTSTQSSANPPSTFPIPPLSSPSPSASPSPPPSCSPSPPPPPPGFSNHNSVQVRRHAVKRKPRPRHSQQLRQASIADDSDDDSRHEDRSVTAGPMDTLNHKRKRVGALRYCTKDRARSSDRTLGGEAEARRRGLLGNNSSLIIERVDSNIKPAFEENDTDEQDTVTRSVGKIRRIQTMLAVSKRGLGGKDVDSKEILDVLLGKIEDLQIQKENESSGRSSRRRKRKENEEQQRQQTIQISPSFLLDQAPGGKEAFVEALRYVRDRLMDEVTRGKQPIGTGEIEGARELLNLWEEHLVEPRPPLNTTRDHDQSSTGNKPSGSRTVEVHTDWILALQKLLKTWDQAVAGDDSAVEELEDNGPDWSTQNGEMSTEWESDFEELDNIPGTVNVQEEERLSGFSADSLSSSENVVPVPVKGVNATTPLYKTESHQLREVNGVREMTFLNRMNDNEKGLSVFLSGAVSNDPSPSPQGDGRLATFFDDVDDDEQESPEVAEVYSSASESDLAITTTRESSVSKDDTSSGHYVTLGDCRRSSGSTAPAVCKTTDNRPLENIPTVSFDDIEDDFLLRKRDEYEKEPPPSAKTKRKVKSKSPLKSSRKILRRSSKGSRGMKARISGKLSKDPTSSSKGEGRSSKWLMFSGARNVAQFESFLQPQACLNTLGRLLQRGDCEVLEKKGDLKLKCHVMLQQGRMTFTVDFCKNDVEGCTVVFKRIDRSFSRSLDSQTFRSFFKGVVNEFTSVNTLRPPAISAP